MLDGTSGSIALGAGGVRRTRAVVGARPSWPSGRPTLRESGWKRGPAVSTSSTNRTGRLSESRPRRSTLRGNAHIAWTNPRNVAGKSARTPVVSTSSTNRTARRCAGKRTLRADEPAQRTRTRAMSTGDRHGRGVGGLDKLDRPNRPTNRTARPTEPLDQPHRSTTGRGFSRSPRARSRPLPAAGRSHRRRSGRARPRGERRERPPDPTGR